jgi:hypothetical protein
LIDADDIVAGVGETPREDAAAASDFDDARRWPRGGCRSTCRRVDPMRPQDPDHFRGRVSGEIAEPRVVNVCEIGAVHG